jgi:hypothetical protein
VGYKVLNWIKTHKKGLGSWTFLLDIFSPCAPEYFLYFLTSFNIRIQLVHNLICFVRSNIKLFPEPSYKLPVTPWMIFQFCLPRLPKLSLILHFQHLYISSVLPYYNIKDSRFYSELFEIRYFIRVYPRNLYPYIFFCHF